MTEAARTVDETSCIQDDIPVSCIPRATHTHQITCRLVNERNDRRKLRNVFQNAYTRTHAKGFHLRKLQANEGKTELAY